MTTLLVPTDFSENANNAIEYALEIAKATGKKLVLFNVYIPSVAPYTMIGPVITENLDSTLALIKEKLDVICRTLQEEYPTVQCSSRIAVGEIVSEIITAAEETKAEMIIMGTQGDSKIENLFFGSNTSAVIERASCPVLSVPFSAPFHVPKKMLFATNFSYHDLNGAVQLTAIARAFNASIIIAHVMVGKETLEHEKPMIEKFSKEVGLLTDYPKISYRILSDNTVSMGLDNVIAETQADLMALSTRKRTLFEKFYNPSLTRKFSAHSSIPLLAFHNPEDSEDHEF